MPKISKQKKDKIAEQILHYLFTNSPQPKFTAEIARDTARDEEFTKAILNELRAQGLVNEIKKNEQGNDYLRRSRWILSSQVYEVYQNQQRKTGTL
jgi:hypothetical protein